MADKLKQVAKDTTRKPGYDRDKTVKLAKAVAPAVPGMTDTVSAVEKRRKTQADMIKEMGL